MTFEEKKKYLLSLLDLASQKASDWERRRKEKGLMPTLQRFADAPRYFFARFGVGPRYIKTKTFWGYPIVLPWSGSDTHRLSAFGTLGYENEDKVTRFLIRTIQPSDIFYDIGASYGFYTYLASEFVTEGEIHAFEPLPRAFFFLRRNTQGNTRCFLNNCVLSDREGATTFYQGYPSTVSSTMIEKVARMNAWNAYQKTEVPSLTLDSYLKNHQKPTILKIDAEGAEELILKGGNRFLSEYSPTIIMEIWSKSKGEQFSLPAIKELLRLGYAPYTITSQGLLERHDGEFSIAETFENFVFRKA